MRTTLLKFNVLLAFIAIVVSLLMLTGCAGKAIADDAQPEKRRSVTLRYLNDLCGDTWCEGSFSYHFYRISCPGQTCTLEFKARHYDGRRFKNKCRNLNREDYRNIRDWIIHSEKFHDYELAESFMDAVDTCLERFEKTYEVPGVG